MKNIKLKWHVSNFVIVLAIACLCAIFINRAETVSTQQLGKGTRRIIIDAGHGGVDGGATSCTGILESKLNLDICLKLDQLFHLLGYRTTMIRTTDISVYTEGNSIAQKKVSDLKERLRIINETENPLLISIHQNFFQDSQYHGAQVFYAKSAGSMELAEFLQKNFREFDKENHRSQKLSSGVYLMDRIQCSGVLIECGFLSNPQEEAKLRDAAYQQKLCCIIASCTALFLDRSNIS